MASLKNTIYEENEKSNNKHHQPRVHKPSYSQINLEVPALKDLNRKDITGYRLMYPSTHFQRSCLSTESAVGQHHVEDLPLGAKLPHLSGNSVTLQTTAIGKRLQKPSCDFDISTPKETYISNEYNDLHDPHLIAYFQKNESLKQHLIDMGYITNDGAVICSLQKYNLYRQYLKRLSIDLLNKKYHEQYSSEIVKRKNDQKEAIEMKRNSEDNAINLRIENAKFRRNDIDNKKAEKFKIQLENLEERFSIWDDKIQNSELERSKKLAQNEELREKRKQICLQKEQKEQQRIHELVLKKHYEDQKRLFELTKKKSKGAKLRRIRLEENFTRKCEHRKQKQAQLVVLAAEHELRRQARVAQWEQYFRQQLKLQQERLKAIRAQREALKRKQVNTNLEMAKNRSSIRQGAGDQMSGHEIIKPIESPSQGSISISSISAMSEVPSDASSNFKFNHKSQYIIKQVLHSLKYSMDTLTQCIEHFEQARRRRMTDYEMYSLISKLNMEGIKQETLVYNEYWELRVFHVNKKIFFIFFCFLGLHTF